MADEKKASLKSADKEAKAKDAALNAAKTHIEREFGQGSLMRLGDESIVQVDAIPTGALSLDLALGVGGVPRGRIVEIFGPESSGKTTLVYHIIAEAQARGGICAFIDTEHAIDPMYAREIGVDIDELLVSQPDYGEQALEIVDVLVRSGAVDLVAVDSVAALTPRVELEGQMGEMQVVKNKVASPFRQAEFDIEYGVGISNEGCLLDLALEQDLVQKSGSFFSYGKLRLGQGRNNTKQYLAENPEVAQEIEQKLFEALGIERSPASGARPKDEPDAAPIAATPEATPAEEPERKAA